MGIGNTKSNPEQDAEVAYELYGDRNAIISLIKSDKDKKEEKKPDLPKSKS